MDSLNAVLKLVTSLEDEILRGTAVRTALQATVTAVTDPIFKREVLDILRGFEGIHDVERAVDRASTTLRRAVFQTIVDGDRGQPILARLRELTGEIEAQLELDLKTHVEALPMKMLLPLLLLLFPAFLLLLLGPITHHFLEVLGQ